jgi:hypothetical protein
MMREAGDIKAPDGFLLGGERLVRQDGTILFQRGWWQAPKEWAGEYVWVHCTDGGAGDLEVAPPGYSSIYRAQLDVKTVFCPRTKRPDAKPVFRRAEIKDWLNRQSA